MIIGKLRGESMENLEEFLADVPMEVRHSLRALRDDKRWAVFTVLIRKGKLNFNQIKNLLKAHPQEITRILKDLKAAGLIKKFVESAEDLGVREKTYYEPSLFGRELFETLIGIFGYPVPGITTQELFNHASALDADALALEPETSEVLTAPILRYEMGEEEVKLNPLDEAKLKIVLGIIRFSRDEIRKDLGDEILKKLGDVDIEKVDKVLVRFAITALNIFEKSYDDWLSSAIFGKSDERARSLFNSLIKQRVSALLWRRREE